MSKFPWSATTHPNLKEFERHAQRMREKATSAWLKNIFDQTKWQSEHFQQVSK